MIYFSQSPPQPAPPEPRRILIVKMSSLGDVVHALPALAALRALYPRATIHWAVEESLAPLLPGPPALDEIIAFPRNELSLRSLRRSWRRLAAFRAKLKAGRYDLSIDFQALAKSALVAFWAGAKRRLAYWETREASFLVSQGVKGPQAQGHVMERYLDVVRYLGPVAEGLAFPLPDFSPQRAALSQTLLSQGCAEPRVVFYPGASWATKLWPPENYAALGQALARQGLGLVLGGGSAEKGLCQKVMDLAPELPWVNLAGATDLRGLMALASLSRAVVGSDSGPLHVAVAAGRPTVALYGPNCSQRTGAYGPKARNLASPAPCSPCFRKVCPKDFVCMAQIAVGRVLTETLAALAAG
ncbi:MAG: lipopolysaccharide heptosyltransferase II [Deltaproteobacteria bacterium]|nr:lipopolysaccharide heptosyltransferase II [Deltaproteobacteria bacterium]